MQQHMNILQANQGGKLVLTHGCARSIELDSSPLWKHTGIECVVTTAQHVVNFFLAVAVCSADLKFVV